MIDDGALRVCKISKPHEHIPLVVYTVHLGVMSQIEVQVDEKDPALTSGFSANDVFYRIVETISTVLQPCRSDALFLHQLEPRCSQSNL